MPQQIDLFAENALTIGGAPTWPDYPWKRQAALTTLITRLILDHADKGPDIRRGAVMISDKIRPYHLERKATLYVRQSSAHRVLHNRERL
jgi:hypothetical protein